MCRRQDPRPALDRAALALSSAAVAATLSGTAAAGGLMLYEVGTADVGLASAGYNARAQDASTALTNPAGMTRLDGNQFLAGAQLLWANTKFSIGSATSPALGSNDGGYLIGHDGWFGGGGGFLSYTLSPDVKVGFALTGNFGGVINYDNNWVGRYYVQQTWTLGFSLLPSVAWKVNDKLSVGASVNAMYGIYKNNVAINNVDPRLADGQLKLKDETWGWGANLGLLYEFTPATRLGVTWNSQVSLDFSPTAKFQGLSPLVNAALGRAGLLDATVNVGIKVPQQAMASLYTQVDEQWALLGSVGWQQWSRFGEIQISVDDSTNPISVTAKIPLKDTWHVAAGAQYRVSDPWLLNFGIAYDSKFQPNNSQVSPLLPLNAVWRFGVGGQQQLDKAQYWGLFAEYAYGGTLDVNIQGARPAALGGRGDLVGSYQNAATVFFGAYYNWTF
jgi:long-chain fatty acid transport protein